jgi:hypothetical protein
VADLGLANELRVLDIRGRPLLLPLPACACAVALACGGDSAGRTATAPADTWARIRDTIVEEYMQAHPGFAIVQGRHEFDG